MVYHKLAGTKALERGGLLSLFPGPGSGITLTAQQHLALPRRQAIFQTLWGSYHPHFAEKEIEAQRVKVTEAELMLLAATVALSAGPLRLRGGHSSLSAPHPAGTLSPPALPLPHPCI